MTNAGFTRIEQYADVEARGQFAQATAAGVPEEAVLAGLSAMSRDNARTPMPWTPEGGFTTGTPWLPLNANTASINVADDVADPDGVAAHYKALIALRREDAVVRDGAFELLLPDDETLWAFTRTLGDERLLVVANMSSHLAGCRSIVDTGSPRAAAVDSTASRTRASAVTSTTSPSESMP